MHGGVHRRPVPATTIATQDPCWKQSSMASGLNLRPSDSVEIITQP